VREALKRLTAEGLVGVGEGNGLVVRIHSVEEIIDTYVVHEVVQALAAALPPSAGPKSMCSASKRFSTSASARLTASAAESG
jgi:DNA-binding GntR family transcriptional regulator